MGSGSIYRANFSKLKYISRLNSGQQYKGFKSLTECAYCLGEAKLDRESFSISLYLNKKRDSRRVRRVV
jgi:hypothetical protein